MSCILHIETSTSVCSVAVSEDGKVIFDKADRTGNNHAEALGSFVDEAMSFADSHAIPLDAVAVVQAHIRVCALACRWQRECAMLLIFR